MTKDNWIWERFGTVHKLHNTVRVDRARGNIILGSRIDMELHLNRPHLNPEQKLCEL